MKKLLTFLTLLTLFFTTAWAEEQTITVSITGFGGDNGTSYTTSAVSATFGGVNFKANNFIGSKGQVRGNQTSVGSNFYISNTSEMPGNITKIEFSTVGGSFQNNMYALTGTSSQANVTSLDGAVAGTLSQDNKTFTWNFNSSSGITYFKLLTDEKFTSGNATGATITITYEEGDTPPTPTCAKPTFSPAGGTYTEAQNVTISCETDDATIYYTTNGDDPTTSSSVYSSAIAVSETTTIKAMAAATDMNNSAVASATYTIETPPEPSTDQYELVTNISQLSAGDQIIIANTATAGDGDAISTTQNENNRAATAVTIANSKITPSSSVQILTLEKEGDNWLFNTGSGYLYAASSSKNWLRTETTADANAQATISISNNAATVTFQGSNTHNILKYNANNGNPLFSCYNTEGTVYIYKKVTSTPSSNDVYIIGQVNGNDSDPWVTSEGVKMTYSNNNDNYTADIYCTGVNTGDKEGYSFFLFAKSLPYNWNTTSNLYGSGADGSYWGIGGSGESAFGEEISLYEGSKNSYRLAAGLYTITVDLLSSAEGLINTTKSVKVTKRDVTMTISPSYAYFEDTQTVTMASNLTDIGGKIYYTTDGSNPSDPNSSRLEYTGAITISETTTFKAVAFVGNLYSAIVDKTFTKTPKTPVINPNGGIIHEETQVTITCETEGASIYYTLDGSTPTNVVSETNFLYSEPFTIDETTTVKARAYVGNTYSNGIATAEFVYTEPYVPGEGDFVRVTSKDDLVAGREYIIVTADYNWAMGAISTDDKRAAASQDFDISTDHSTVTLTENSTVNVMKLEDGRVYPSDDTKYWNLKQENGQYVYLNNSGTQISQSAQTYLSGYSKELIINITAGTNENNYAIITEGGNSQILYSKGPNNTAGYFRYFSNTNQNNSAYSRVFLYYRDVPPTEATLAQIIALGENADGKKYKIKDEDGLLGVYRHVYENGTSSVWFKDEEQAVDYQNPTPTTGTYQYYNVVETTLDINKSEKDFAQNNWIEVVFPSDANYTNAYVKNLTGTYSCENGNPKLTVIAPVETGDVNQLQPSELAYELNPYMAANFVGSQKGYFFSEPKAQEYAQILWAVYNGNNEFIMPTGDDNYYEFTGSFTINPELNAYSISGLKTNSSYNFKAIIRKSASKAGPYEVYPTDLNPDVPTAINGVVVNGNVKSVKYVNVAGMVSDVPFQGVNIVVTEYTDGSRTTSKMLKK